MGRLLRAGFDLHFTRNGHECWMERQGVRTTIFEDSPQSEAPLYNMRLKVMPQPAAEEQKPGGWLVAPIENEGEEPSLVGSEVKQTGLSRNTSLNGMTGRVMRRSPANPDRWSVRLTSGTWVNVKNENIMRLDLPGA